MFIFHSCQSLIRDNILADSEQTYTDTPPTFYSQQPPVLFPTHRVLLGPLAPPVPLARMALVVSVVILVPGDLRESMDKLDPLVSLETRDPLERAVLP